MNKIFKRYTTMAVILLLALVAAGCRAGAVTEDIKASPAQVSLAVGGTQQLTITFTTYDVGTMKPKTQTDVTANSNYKSSDESVATISKDGVVTGVKPGSATITVGYSVTVKVKGGGIATRKTTVPVQVK